MSWLRNEDDMLDHEKWRRAIREGGDGVLLIWEWLREWSARRLTDGRIPSDMVDEVAQLRGSKLRAKALRALVEARLIEQHVDGSLLIVGYLDRNPSREQVLAERERRAQAQKNRRVARDVTGHAPTSDPQACSVPSRPVPIPSHDHPTDDPPVVPQGDAKAPKPKTERKTRLPAEFKPDATTVRFAAERNVSLERELPKFTNHHTAKGTLMLNWQAALRTWIGNAEEWGPQRHPPGTRPTHPVDRAIQRGVTELERIRAREAEEERRMT